MLKQATSANNVLEIHRRFCESLPKDLLWIENPDSADRIKTTPGELRQSDVKVETYKSHLATCDQPRRNDLDGRGNLSEEALAEFTKFFIGTCIDQVSFMEELIQPKRLHARIMNWADDETRSGDLPGKSSIVLEAALYRGELPRGDVSGLLGVGDRSARRVTSILLDRGVLTSKSHRAPLYLAFPASLASRWMPDCFRINNKFGVLLIPQFTGPRCNAISIKKRGTH